MESSRRRGDLRWVVMSLMVWLVGCAHYMTVEVPPEIVLTQFPAVGVIQFTGAASRASEMSGYATQRFIQQLTQAQPGVRILELGTMEEILAKVGRPRLDAEAIREVGQHLNVQVVFVGSTDATEARPTFNLGRGGFGVSADVTGTLNATLYDTAQGALVWTRSVRQADTAGGGGLGRGGIEVAVGGEDNAQARIFGRAAWVITDAFRPHVVTRRVE